MRHLIPICALLISSVGTGPTAPPPDSAPQRIFVRGTYVKGSNVTEPKPRESQFFKVRHAGFIVLDTGAAYFLDADVRKTPTGTNYIRVEFENPKDKSRPFVNDMELTPDTTEVRFTSPDVVSGIRNYKDYTIKVSVFARKDDPKPIDTLVQPLRAYVDTTTGEVRIDKHLRPK